MTTSNQLNTTQSPRYHYPIFVLTLLQILGIYLLIVAMAAGTLYAILVLVMLYSSS